MNRTIDYYNQNAEAFVGQTMDVKFDSIQNRFLSLLSKNSYILDFGCGSGRDTKYFLDNGYRVDAVDGSAELCKIAEKYTGTCVRQLLFSELDEIEKYDGIWACSSILHLPKAELGKVFEKMLCATKNDGYIYTSFKYGTFEGYRNDRYYTDFTEESFMEFLEGYSELKTVDLWASGDVRKDRENEKWLNMILQKSITN